MLVVMPAVSSAPKQPTAGAGEHRGLVRVERGTKRVRAYLAGHVVADTIAPLLVWEGSKYPMYYFPRADVRAQLLDEDAEPAHSPSRGEASVLTVLAGEARAPGAALHYQRSAIELLEDTVRLDWGAMEAWLEEDEEIFVHPRDPYRRVDVLASSRLVRVSLDGLLLAESPSPRLLFETGLRVRYYLPRPHVHMEHLLPSPTVTHCPYKGTASTWSVRADGRLYEDMAWSYPSPLPESQRIQGLIAFYDEKLDVEVDGVLQPRKRTDRA
jgi:uncharacterized protein (DUF427 family)